MPDQMSEKLGKLFIIFKKAVESEREAQEMYKEAILLCEDELTKKVLEGLYQDEIRHERNVIGSYNRLRSELKIQDE